MKRCPECRRDFYDDSLSFCLDDGTPLVDGPATGEPATAMLLSVDQVGESPTAILSTSTSPLAGSESIAAGSSSTSSAEYIFNAIGRRKFVFAVASLSLLLVAGGISFAIYKYGLPGNSDTGSGPFASIKIERLTSNGKATQAVISPDGKQVVYVLDDAGQRSLWLRQVATATDVQLTEPTRERFYWALTVSRDGDYLYYVYGGTSVRNRILYQMPLVGGSSRKVIEDVGSPVGFSPDGKQIAFVRSREKESAMMIANADGSEEREIAVRPGSEAFGSLFNGGVTWSADGTKIFSVANKREDDARVQSIVEISIADGTQEYVTQQTWYQIQRLALLADGSGLLITAAAKASDYRTRQLWLVPYPTGEPRKITNDLNDYTNISLNSDSSVLVIVQEDNVTNIWVAPDADASRATELKAVSGKLDGYDGVTWTPDGKILYSSMTSGNEDIWIMDGDGKNRKQLTSGDNPDFWPSVSTDGRYVVFTSERGRSRRVWTMGVDGADPRELFPGNQPQGAGDWIVYGGNAGLTKAPLNGGEHVQIDTRGHRLSRCSVSPEGRRLACQTDNQGEQTKLAIIEIEGNAPAQLFDVKLELPARIRWARDGRAVTFVSRIDGERDIWSQPVDGGAPKRLTSFKAAQIFSFDWSNDNRLVISHGKSDSDVVLIRNAK
jgi:Tol biopolymer transport system component